MTIDLSWLLGLAGFLAVILVELINWRRECQAWEALSDEQMVLVRELHARTSVEKP